MSTTTETPDIPDATDLAFTIIAEAADAASESLPAEDACELFERLAYHFTMMADGLKVQR